LLVDDKGKPLPQSHPGRVLDETWTCAQCHAREAYYDPTTKEVNYIRPMDFRMVGYGHLKFFGIPRPNNRAMLSPFLMATALPKIAGGPVYPRPTGDGAKTKTSCNPFDGCSACSYHQDYKWCLVDAAFLPQFKFHDKALKIDFPDLQKELEKHAKQCVADVEAKKEEFGQCDFLICAEQRARGKADLAVSGKMQKAFGDHNDPTFQCPIDEPFSRLRPAKSSTEF
jgi:hypothetical protein